ncbi:MAG: 5-(carboxyamino)imidazole ribonucleotide mutase [Acidobacteria bacterium]|nr:MAG: 5-(carboxyamino)imidazole ribonucleotide mutase [Acidobacteriota bacterium]PYU44894.1 MAG: 5-(carboxyamino)imidazole ribonucleotide mutase [Acidobacteriota bacterium]PYU76336.1 MAG: 5-(carboxyamino)imidazole ribonucleotide mutase [Acidobacteriota bacterium]
MARKKPKESIRGDGQAGADTHPLVGIIMGSGSDWDTMKYTSRTLAGLGVPHETRVVSAHRTPNLLFEYASAAEKRGIEVIIAGAGGAAHLPGMTASKTVLPVLGVPVESRALKGLDSLLSIAQMPGGIPVGTLAIGKAGAINAALLAAAILGAKHPAFREAFRKFRTEQTGRVLANPDPSVAAPPEKKGKHA